MIRNSDIDRLRGLFAKRLIATMDMLKKTVGTVADQKASMAVSSGDSSITDFVRFWLIGRHGESES